MSETEVKRADLYAATDKCRLLLRRCEESRQEFGRLLRELSAVHDSPMKPPGFDASNPDDVIRAALAVGDEIKAFFEAENDWLLCGCRLAELCPPFPPEVGRIIELANLEADGRVSIPFDKNLRGFATSHEAVAAIGKRLFDAVYCGDSLEVSKSFASATWLRTTQQTLNSFPPIDIREFDSRLSAELERAVMWLAKRSPPSAEQVAGSLVAEQMLGRQRAKEILSPDTTRSTERQEPPSKGKEAEAIAWFLKEVKKRPPANIDLVEIANAVGCHRTTLSRGRAPTLRAIIKAHRDQAPPPRIRRGSKDAEGNLEAFNEDE